MSRNIFETEVSLLSVYIIKTENYSETFGARTTTLMGAYDTGSRVCRVPPTSFPA